MGERRTSNSGGFSFADVVVFVDFVDFADSVALVFFAGTVRE
jgi:hypothetical protein